MNAATHAPLYAVPVREPVPSAVFEARAITRRFGALVAVDQVWIALRP
ncbi:MAG: hypothetical protein RLZZ584_2682, partial [Pseudomonadota bacterium]